MLVQRVCVSDGVRGVGAVRFAHPPASPPIRPIVPPAPPDALPALLLVLLLLLSLTLNHSCKMPLCLNLSSLVHRKPC